jgi:cell division protein FtsI (penicillin-binding protein 3)
MAARDEIVWRGGLVYFAIGLLAVAILVRILILQYVQRGKWADMSEKYVFKTAEMTANRGDILTSDDRLLASSVPYYTIYMDTRSSGMLSATWSDGINGLSAGLAQLLGERSASGWKSVITRPGKRAIVISSYNEKLTMKNLRR